MITMVTASKYDDRNWSLSKWGGEVSLSLKTFKRRMRIGFGLKIILQLLVINLFPLIALGLFATWWTAIILWVSIIIFSYLAIRSNEKHQIEYDDRLSNDRMKQALERYIKEVKK